MGAASTIFYTFQSLVWCGWDSNPQPLAPKEDTLPTELSGRYKVHLHKYFWAVYIFIFFLGGGGGGGGGVDKSMCLSPVDFTRILPPPLQNFLSV